MCLPFLWHEIQLTVTGVVFKQHTLDEFDLYLSTPNLSTGLAKPKIPHDIQDSFLHIVLNKKKKVKTLNTNLNSLIRISNFFSIKASVLWNWKCTLLQLVLCQPLTPVGDQDRISPYNINIILSRQVMRIKTIHQ